MKNFLFSASAMLLTGALVLGCAKQQSAPAPVTPPTPVAVTPVTIPAPQPVVEEAPAVTADEAQTEAPPSLDVSGTNWQLTLPEAGWAQKTVPGAPALLLLNDEKKNFTVMVSEATDATLAQILAKSKKVYAKNGAKIVSIKQVKNNGITFTYVALTGTDTVGGKVNVFAWFTVKDGISYRLTCGGDPETDQKAVCTSIFNTLKIN